MYNNVGKQIKNLVATISIIEIAACVITGIIVMCLDFEDTWWIGLLIIVGGLFLAWISSLFLYAYGELVDKTSLIESYLRAQHKEEMSSDSINDFENNTYVIEQEQQKPFEHGEWECSKCGKYNQRYVGICDCGQLKSNNSK